mmetsp:Transcript_8784/g.13116  ORF Transcript_8784/g.13116 Transcript_8784/m.13116 type:complete len:255 (+) Transcript_8784:3-767(+)
MALVTGAGSGIGRALARRLAMRGVDIFPVGRREDKLIETAQLIHEDLKSMRNVQVSPIAADISKASGREEILSAIGSKNLRFIVHNAGVIDPVKPLGQMKEEEWNRVMEINVNGPLFLTNKLVPTFFDDDIGTRVLFVGSGAAHNAYSHWGAYCTSKAALHMLWKSFRLEKPMENVFFGSVRPGVVDTPMQSVIRESNMDNVENFRRLKSENQLTTVEEVAAFLDFLLHDALPEEYEAEEWDIRDPKHRHRWEI